jgi:ABC-type sulfate transport system permease subunit
MASGTFRTMNNMGMICSFAVAIIVAASAVPKQLAFEIFAGTSILTESLMGPFVLSLRDAFIVSSVIMGLAVVLSWVRDTKRAEAVPSPTASA